MSTARLRPTDAPDASEPAWEVAYLFPPQGEWDDGDYLGLTTNRLVELTDGHLELLPMPTEYHQDVVITLFQLITAFVEARGLGKTSLAPLRMRIRRGKFREPDVLFMKGENAARRQGGFWDRADLVVEVVSEDDPSRDWEKKLADYADAGIPEYWIADPRDKTLTVFTLDPGAAAYREAGRYREGEAAKSLLLDGLTIDVAAAFQPR